ncbi:hypothetical protein [Xanthomonas phage MET13-T1]|nr:hypothetical protein [Xanthomonas phage MET13-T1]
MFEVKFGGKRHLAATLADASKLFTAWIDANDFGASDLKKSDGFLYKEGSRTYYGYVSYNGRTWRGVYGQEGHVEIFDRVIETTADYVPPTEEAPAATVAIAKPKTIADVIRAGISAGLDNGEVLAEVKKAFPEGSTSAACVSYYRSKMKKSPAAKALAAPAEARKVKVELKSVEYLVKEWRQGFTAKVYVDGKAYCTVIDMDDEASPHFEFSHTDAYELLNIEELRTMAADILAKREYDRLTKGKVCIMKDSKLYTIKGASLELVRQKNPTATVINGMTVEQFRKVLKTVADAQ